VANGDGLKRRDACTISDETACGATGMLGDLRNYKMCLATRRGLWRDGEIQLAIMGASRDAGGTEL
jgi:hypothetical protein